MMLPLAAMATRKYGSTNPRTWHSSKISGTSSANSSIWAMVGAQLAGRCSRLKHEHCSTLEQLSRLLLSSMIEDEKLTAREKRKLRREFSQLDRDSVRYNLQIGGYGVAQRREPSIQDIERLLLQASTAIQRLIS